MAGNANYATDLASSTFQIFMRSQPSDAIFGDLVLFDVLGKRDRVTKRGGIKILEPLMYAKSTAVGFYSGWDPLDVSPQEGLTNAEFDWKQFYLSVSISAEEELKNQGEAQMLKLLEAKIEQAQMSAADAMDAALFLDGTAGNGKGVVGLALAVDSAGTYGNIVRSSNTWWSAQETAVSGVLTITGTTGMRRMYNDCALGRNRMTPNLIVTTQIAYEAYEALMDPYMRYTVTGEQNVGFRNQNLMFRDAPLFWDDYCQSGVMYFLNTKHLRIVVMEGRGDGDGQGDFRTEPFQKPVNQDGKVAHAFWMGNIVSSNCRHQGKLTGLTNA